LGQVSTGRHGPRHGPRGIYDNIKTAVETIIVGKHRLYNRPLPADVQPLIDSSRKRRRIHAA
jgi:hypothetical protein